MGHLRRSVTDSLRSIAVGALLCVFAGLPLFAAENIKAVGAVAKANIKAVGAVSEANIKAVGGVDNTAAGGGNLVTENFEGTGAPSGWATSAGTIQYDHATTALSLEASECLYITAEAGAEQAYVAFTDSDAVYAYFMMRVEDVPTGSGRTFFKLTNNAGTVTCFENAPNIGPLQFKLYDTSGTHTATSGSTTSADQTYHVWVEYEKGTGANGQIRVYSSTTTTKPGSPDAAVTNADSTSQGGRLYFGIDWAGAGGNIYFDKLRISNSAAFGSDPS